MDRRHLLAGAATLLVAACQQDPVVKAALTAAPPVPAQAVPIADIVDRKWVLDAITPSADNAFAWSRLGISMRLGAADRRAGGYGGCNTWSAGFTSDGPGQLRFGPAIATRMACSEPPGVMALESEFFAALAKVTGYTRSEDHLFLQLEGGGQMTMIRDNVASG